MDAIGIVCFAMSLRTTNSNALSLINSCCWFDL